jgi:small-conductance mechanosensitive channel/CRP-like cAMP-binding protein
VILAMSGVVAWTLAGVIGVAGILVGALLLKGLARLRFTWWPALISPAIAFGPAVGLLVGSSLATGTAASMSFWSPDAHPAALAGWTLIVIFGALGAYAFVVRFLTSSVVVDTIGLKVPDVYVALGRFVLLLLMAFVVVGGVWRRSDLFSALITAGTAGSVILLLLFQDTIKNFIAAWAIFDEGVYAIGDWVWIGEDEGEVISVTRRTTKIQNRQGDLVTIPNAMVTAGKTRNQSRPTPAHAEFVRFFASYATPPNRVRDAVRRAVLEVPAIVANPSPRFRVRAFGESAIEYEAKVWLTDVASVPDILSDLRIQVWYRFQREGIEFQAPVRELRRGIHQEEPFEAKARAIDERLKTVPFFGALPEDLRTVLARDAGLVRFGSGERVVRQGEPGDTCYVVDSGRLAVLVSDGKAEREVARLGPGDLFGEMSLLTGEPRAATVRVVDDARLVSVGSTSLRAALEASPDLANRLAEVTALRKEGLLEARAALDAESRARVDAQTYRLRELIHRFFRLTDVPSPRTPSPPPGSGVAGGRNRP